MNKQQIIDQLQLLPHPEGGYFAKSYRSAEQITAADGRGVRAASTGIYFLLGRNDKSHLHRIKSDEMWHHYLGGTLSIVEISEESHEVKITKLGSDILNGEVVQHMVPKNTWFGAFFSASEKDNNEWSLVGCTVAPGFDFADFELAKAEELLKQFPEAAEMINFLSPK